jgi:L-aspartate oxidase
MLEWTAAHRPTSGIAPESSGSALSADEIRALAWERCGIIRDAAGLQEACRRLGDGGPTDSPQLANMRQVALLIARCALAREESRGAHFRRDYPHKEKAFRKHSMVSKGAEVRFR